MGKIKHFLVSLPGRLAATFLVSICLLSPCYAVFTIPPKPIFLANDTQANIFFALDDSGSMDAELLINKGARAALEDLTTSIFGSFFTSVLNQADIIDMDFTPDDLNEDWHQCAAFNLMAYDPSQTYTPWSGNDNTGTPYADQSITSARINPFDPSAGTTNLLNVEGTGRPAWYGVEIDNSQCRTDLGWPDMTGISGAEGVNDGTFQICECFSSNFVTGINFFSYGDRFDFLASAGDPRFFRVDTLSAAEQTNYANWFSYFRKRDYVLKKAVSQLITSSSARMGLATLQNNGGVGTAIRDMTDASNKSTLLNNLFSINPDFGTPLRTLLRDVGRYFDDTDGSNTLHSALGFTEASPILPASEGGECQQNFTVLFSDGFWNGFNPSDVFNEDGDSNTAFDGGPHADSVHPSLGDVAMKYYETDLSNVADNVPVITGIDENTAQHLVTYTVSYGLDGTLTSVPADHDPTTPSPPWPTPVAGTLTTVDDMRHAAFNARGLYLPGQNPQQLIDTLSAALADIGSRTGAASAAASTSQSVKTEALIFQGTFNSEDWSGTLSAFPLSTTGTIGSAQWEASSLIPAESSRTIFSFNKTTPVGIEFKFNQLSAAQQTAIGTDAEDIVNYVRGDRTQETGNGGAFRNRNSLLGDIIHSTPVAVTSSQASPPFENLPGTEGSSYAAHLTSKSSITDAVFVGSNDGMLHAFNADTGEEIMAYVPEGVFSKLNLLTDPAYDHAFYVDGVLSAADVFFGGAWRTILVGTLGRGGNTVFALDVTSISTFTEANVLWEFEHEELGNVLGKPQIVRLNNGKWAVVLGNGYNTTSEKPELFVIDVETGTLTRRITAGDETDAGNNGLSTALVVDTDSDFISDVVYAGDLNGKLWKFDFSSSNSSTWSVALGNTPLYQAVASNGSVQPITSKPAIAAHPNGGFQILFGTGRFFAQGDEVVSDSGTSVETFYGIRDNGLAVTSVGARNNPPGSQPSGTLQPQSIVSETSVISGSTTSKVRLISDNTVDYTGTGGGTAQQGWYIDLVSPVDGVQGERIIADPQLRDAQDTPVILFNTFVPGGSCQSVGGFSALMVLDALNGSRTSFAVFDLNKDGIIDNSDTQDSTGFAFNGRVQDQSVSAVTVVSNGDATQNFVIQSSTESVSPTISTVAGSISNLGRQSWRQLQ